MIMKKMDIELLDIDGNTVHTTTQPLAAIADIGVIVWRGYCYSYRHMYNGVLLFQKCKSLELP